MVKHEGKESQTNVISGIWTLYTNVEKTRCILKGTGAQCTCISSVMPLENVFDRISMSLPSIFYAKHIITILQVELVLIRSQLWVVFWTSRYLDVCNSTGWLAFAFQFEKMNIQGYNEAHRQYLRFDTIGISSRLVQYYSIVLLQQGACDCQS